MDINQILLWIQPFLVYIVTELVKKFKPLIPGWIIVSVVVPVLSAIVAVIIVWANPSSSFLIQLVGGLLAVFLNEIVRQLKQINK